MLYEGRPVRKKEKKKSRLIVKALVLCASLILIVGTIGGTLAWLTTDTEPVINTFSPSHVSCEVEEAFDSDTGVKENVKIKNTSDIPAYIRVRLVGYSKDAEGNIVGGTGLPENLVNMEIPANWLKIGEYYYYLSPVAPDASTANLIDRCELPEGQVLEILAEAIQSEPAEAVTSAWAVTVNPDGTISKEA